MALSDGHQTSAPTELPLVLLHREPNFPVRFLPLLRSRYRILDPNEESDSDPKFLALSRSVRILLCWALFPVNSQILDRYPSVECVVATSAGLDHIDLAECRRRGIRVSNNSDIFSDDVADYAVGLLIDVLRRVSYGDRFVRAGLWPVKQEFPLGLKVGGKRVGIVGLGNIGLRIGKRLEGFGCIIGYNSRKPKPEIQYPYFSNILELAQWSDILILSCSSTTETFHIVDKNVMTALGREGIIINIGRGSLIDEKELCGFLVRGEIGGAGLDVFENEPYVPRELFDLNNVVLSPHKAAITTEAIEAIPEIVMKNIDAFFSNKPLLSEVSL
ncbi:hypothetical protein M9H77_19471 [Catharanthus roseus]|uniref:Uncharacterized protein n=1 Tax=Catharanthus roseus TaxID=4058 RepID=A0ACC0BAG3_CATRO|nr:hypothetical protein M9H77_19471 [Catharanthus roseus]